MYIFVLPLGIWKWNYYSQHIHKIFKNVFTVFILSTFLCVRISWSVQTLYIRVKCFLVGWRWYQMRIFNINNLRQCFRFEIFNSKSDCWKIFTSKENHIYAPWHLNLISYTFGANFLRSMITCCDILLKCFMISTIGRGNISKLLCHCTICFFSNWWKFQFFDSIST